jgi:hypothetical protein
MATNTKRKKRLLFKITDFPPVGILEQLLTCFTFFHDELTVEELRPYWEEYRDPCMGLIGVAVQDIVADFFPAGSEGVPVPFGSRPWAWWQFDALEMRRLLSGDPALADWESGNFFGTPLRYASAEAHKSMVFETQPEFLTRLNLWMPGELEAWQSQK